MDQQEDRWKDMDSYFFVDYNNGFQKDYTFFNIEKQYRDKDWKDFINKIPTTRFSGCQATHFQRALQEAGIFFTSGVRLSENKFLDYMGVEFNRTHYKILEHSNSGNY